MVNVMCREAKLTSQVTVITKRQLRDAVSVRMHVARLTSRNVCTEADPPFIHVRACGQSNVSSSITTDISGAVTKMRGELEKAEQSEWLAANLAYFNKHSLSTAGGWHKVWPDLLGNSWVNLTVDTFEAKDIQEFFVDVLCRKSKEKTKGAAALTQLFLSRGAATSAEVKSPTACKFDDVLKRHLGALCSKDMHLAYLSEEPCATP